MATNKELNEKVDKLTEMFAQFIQNQSPVQPKIEEKIITKRGRPRGSRSNSIIIDEGTSEPQTARRKRSNWENVFVDDGTEALEEKRADELIKKVSPPPVDKGVRKSPMIKSTCSTCQTTETVPRQFTFEGFHTCQKCLKSKTGK